MFFLSVWIDEETYNPEIIAPEDEKFREILNNLNEISDRQKPHRRLTAVGGQIVID